MAAYGADDLLFIMERLKAHAEDLRRKIVEAIGRGIPKSEAARTFSVSLSSIKLYAKLTKGRRPLVPKKTPDSHPKIGEEAWRILVANMEERPAARLPQRCEYVRGTRFAR